MGRAIGRLTRELLALDRDGATLPAGSTYTSRRAGDRPDGRDLCFTRIVEGLDTLHSIAHCASLADTSAAL